MSAAPLPNLDAARPCSGATFEHRPSLDGMCPAIVDGIPTHRDTNHLTVGYSRHLAPRLDRYLRSLDIDLGAGAVRAG